MRISVIIASLVLGAFPAFAAIDVPPTAPDTSGLQSQITAIQTAMPQPAITVGPGEAVGGAVGSSTRYKREDWVPPRRSRTGNCTLNASGVCTITWTTAFAAGDTPVMLGDPVAVNTAATQPIDCDVTSAPTITGVTLKCFQAQPTVLGATLLSIAGLSVSPFGSGSLSGVTATAAAIPASQ